MSSPTTKLKVPSCSLLQTSFVEMLVSFPAGLVSSPNWLKYQILVHHISAGPQTDAAVKMLSWWCSWSSLRATRLASHDQGSFLVWCRKWGETAHKDGKRLDDYLYNCLIWIVHNWSYCHITDTYGGGGLIIADGLSEKQQRVNKQRGLRNETFRRGNVE